MENIPLNQRIDRTKLEKHPSGDGWLVPMRNGEKAHVLCFKRNGYGAPILGMNEYRQTREWLADGRYMDGKEHHCDLMLDAYVDPYAELKAAHKEGKVIQCLQTTGEWMDMAYPAFNVPVDSYRIKPDWTLGRSVNGFTLQEGQEWHREDWTEDMLPDGWRPLLLGEVLERGDFRLRDSWGDALANGCAYGIKMNSLHFHGRTRRPMPPVKKMVPLGPEDVSPGSALRKIGSNSWYLVTHCTKHCVFYCDGVVASYSYEYMQEKCEISRDGGNTWQECEKEAK